MTEEKLPTVSKEIGSVISEYEMTDVTEYEEIEIEGEKNE